MTRLVGAELLKMRTTRTFWGIAGATLGLVLLAVVLPLAIEDSFERDDVRSLLSSAGASGLMMLVLGVVFGAGEYRHGTIAWTMLVTPVRLRAASGQALACAIAAAAVGLAAALLTAVVALPWLAAKDAESLPSGDVLAIFVGGILYAALAGAFGAALGALLRNQVAAVVLVLIFLFVLDPALIAVFDGYDKFSLSGLGTSISGGSEDEFESELLPFWASTFVWTAYTAVLVGGAALLTSRRDI